MVNNHLSPTVTAVISTYNRCQYIEEAIESLLSQSYPLLQIIVVNDGSTDDTRNTLKKYKNSIEYIEQENQGKAAAINSTIPIIKGDYLWIFDDDDVAFPDAIERHIATLGGHYNPNVFTYGTSLLGTSNANGRILPGSNRNIPTINESHFLISLLSSNFLSTQGMLIPSEKFKELGGFDKNLVRSQDYDLVLKLAATLKPLRVNDPLFILRQHDGARGSSKNRFSGSKRSRMWHVYDKQVISSACQRLKLINFLPKQAIDHENVSQTQISQAYLRRFSVQAKKGLWSSALNDLIQYSEIKGKSNLTDEEKLIIWDAFSEWEAIYDLCKSNTDIRHFFISLSKVSHRISFSIAKAMLFTIRNNNLFSHIFIICTSIPASIFLRRN